MQTLTPTSLPAPTPVPVPNSIAEAGTNQDVARSTPVFLNGKGSSYPDDDPLQYTWTQVYGIDVTDGALFFSGATPSFTAPESVGTVIFELRVDDGYGDSPPDRVRINVLEDFLYNQAAIFVDGDRGNDDEGDGSRDRPYATISGALKRVTSLAEDIYVMSRADGSAYVEAETLHLPTGVSLYGGFGPGWVRDTGKNRTKINGASLAVTLGPVAKDAWFSGFDLTAVDASEAGGDTVGVLADGGSATLYLEDNTIIAGNAGAGSGKPAGSSYGVHLSNLEKVVVRGNNITSGNGGAGSIGARGTDGKHASNNGGRGGSVSGGAGGSGAVPSADGGTGQIVGQALGPPGACGGQGTDGMAMVGPEDLAVMAGLGAGP